MHVSNWRGHALAVQEGGPLHLLISGVSYLRPTDKPKKGSPGRAGQGRGRPFLHREFLPGWVDRALPTARRRRRHYVYRPHLHSWATTPHATTPTDTQQCLSTRVAVLGAGHEGTARCSYRTPTYSTTHPRAPLARLRRHTRSALRRKKPSHRRSSARAVTKSRHRAHLMQPAAARRRPRVWPRAAGRVRPLVR